MFAVRKSAERGHAHHGWLESFHTFSFADYHDPQHMGFRTLRVLNEDRVQPGQGFGTHAHRDMEILSYVVEGALEHRDSMGHGSRVGPGELQLLRAGTGITHSEYNPSPDELLHFLQIWILPREPGLEPAYAQREIPREERAGRLRLVASPDGREDSLPLAQDALVYASLLEAGESAAHALQPGRGAWVQLVRGGLTVEGQRLEAGDGAAVEGVAQLALRAEHPAELLLFDLG